MKSIHFLVFVSSLVLLCHVRAEEPGRKLESLTTTKNRTYQKVEIREITPAGVKIAHDSGAATIPFEELPKNLQSQLGGFDRQAAEDYRQKQNTALKDQEEAIDKEMAKKKQEVTPVKPTVAPKKTTPQAKELGLPASPQKTAIAPAPQAKEAAAKKPTADRGALTTRIVGYRSGIKRVEFKARANCAATLEVHQVIPDEHSAVAHTDTYDVPANTDIVREVWVYNNYSSDLFNQKGETIDSESTDKKSQLKHPTLR